MTGTAAISEADGEAAFRALLARPAVVRLMAALDGDGEEVRIVGGAVRNVLMGRPASDIDCATTALPDETMRRATAAGLKAVPTGIEHGTVTIVVDGEPFEVTTLREDVETDGRHARVAFGRDFRTDALRRDFTINALSLDGAGRLHDYAGGLADIEARRVRFIGQADQRIAEDYLRILRLFRFHAEYGEGPIDAEGYAAAIRGRVGLVLLSRERVRTELLKLLAARDAVPVLRQFAEGGFISGVLNIAPELGRFERAAIASLTPVERLAALAVRVREDADALRELLRLSNCDHQTLLAYARVAEALPLVVLPLDAAAIRRLAYRHGIPALAAFTAVVTDVQDELFAPYGAAQLARLRSGVERVPGFPLTGARLLEVGLPSGPDIGRRLARAEAAWVADGLPEGEGILANLLRIASADNDLQ